MLVSSKSTFEVFEVYKIEIIDGIICFVIYENGKFRLVESENFEPYIPSFG